MFVIFLILRKNIFNDINNIIEFLSLYKYLTSFQIYFSSSSKVKKILNKIQNLLFINNKSTEEYVNIIILIMIFWTKYPLKKLN